MKAAQIHVRWLGATVVTSPAPVALATQHTASNGTEVERAAAEAKPGDEIVMVDGQWKDQAIRFVAKGQEGKPITLRAQTPGKVVLVGKSSLVVEGSCGVVSGLSFKDDTAT